MSTWQSSTRSSSQLFKTIVYIYDVHIHCAWWQLLIYVTGRVWCVCWVISCTNMKSKKRRGKCDAYLIFVFVYLSSRRIKSRKGKRKILAMVKEWRTWWTSWRKMTNCFFFFSFLFGFNLTFPPLFLHHSTLFRRTARPRTKHLRFHLILL